jgi:hypothetical protein
MDPTNQQRHIIATTTLLYSNMVNFKTESHQLRYYSIAVITFYLLRPLQIQSVQLFITFAT